MKIIYEHLRAVPAVFQPPVSDVEDGYAVVILHRTLLVTGLFLLLLLPVSLVYSEAHGSTIMWLHGGLLAGIVGLLVALRGGYSGGLQWLALPLLWAGTFAMAFVVPHYHLMMLMSDVLMILIAGLLLRPPLVLLMTGLSVVSSLTLMAAGRTLLPGHIATLPRDDLLAWAIYVLLFVIAGGMVYVFTRQMHRVMAHDRQNQRRLAEVNRHLHQQILAQDRLRKTLESFQNPLQSIIRDVPLVMFSGGQGSAFTLMDQRGLQLLPPFNGVLPGSDPLKAALLRGESFHSLSGDGERYYETFLSPVHNAGGSLIAVLGVALDVTEQQRTRQALVESEEKFRRMVEHSPDVILVMSEQDSRILHVNPIIEPVLGYAPAAIVGAHIETLLATAPAQGQATDLIAFRRADDSICLMEQSAHNIPWPAQMAVMLTLRDVTEREKVRADKLAALQMQQEVEQHQARIRAQENFINVIVHQIRSPLTTILMSTDTLRDYADRLTEAQKLERLKKIARQALRMNEMLNDLLMVRQGMLNVLTFEPQPLLLDDFCQEFGDAVQNSETGNHTFGYANRSGIACALLDARLLYHILDNLIRNAIKYSPAGGRISLTIGLEEDWLLFQVQDAGLGIPAAALPGLFQLFYRADNVKHIRGTGIGLVIVRDCVQAHRGSVAVDSVEGQGTTFTVRLPCVVAEVSSPSADEKSGR